MNEYLFDIKLFASIRVNAISEREARAMITQALNYASINAGAWVDGSPILLEASLDGDLDLVEVDGHPV